MKKKLDLRKVADCRYYIEHWDHLPEKPTFVETSDGRRIDFATMTDDDAIFVANELYSMTYGGTRVH